MWIDLLFETQWQHEKIVAGLTSIKLDKLTFRGIWH